jgi:hypothetical protein
MKHPGPWDIKVTGRVELRIGFKPMISIAGLDRENNALVEDDV